jgi:hypothetical protein
MANHTISATFAINQYTVTASAGSNGSLDSSTPSPVTVNHGGTISFKFNANSNYHVASVSGCSGTPYSNASNTVTTYTYTTGPITANCTLTSSFAINTYTVTPSVTGSGTIAPPTPQTVNYNQTKQFTVTQDTGYSIISVTGTCGGTLAANNTYTTNAVTANCTVIANFAINVPPTVGAITTPVDPIQIGSPVAVSASFTDTGITEIHTALWYWDDGITSAGNVTDNHTSGSVNGSNTYTVAGVRQVKLTVTDSCGASGTTVQSGYIVVYDPSGGFVTGGGWINSPAGAYRALPQVTGKANFGFESKYKKNVTVPTGETEFQFSVANMNFHSDSYEWLVVSGAKAQYKGVGTINGTGNYGFILTAIDGQINGGGGTDKFRIKIWNKNNADTIVYDNMLGDPDTSDPKTVIGGGSIMIHK